MNYKRIVYLLNRVLESPFPFLIKKAKVELNKRVIYLPNSPLLSLRINKYKKVIQQSAKTYIKPKLNESQLNYLYDRVTSYSENGYPCLGYGPVDIVGDNAFNTDCVHNYTWDCQKPSFEQDFIASNSKSDVKIPWEKSRLQWLVEKAILFVNGRWSEQELFQHLLNWDKQNVFLKGINWVSSMEVAIRLINLCVVYEIVYPNCNSDLKKLIEKQIANHCVYLDLFPEISDIPGNHYLATEAGKVVVYSLMRKQYCSKLFENLLEQQFPDDGMHLEYASIYHRLCLDLATISTLYLSRTQEVPPSIIKKLRQITETLPPLTSSSGLLPIFGDSDSGQVLNFGQRSRSAKLYSEDIVKDIPETIYSEVLNSIAIDKNHITVPFKGIKTTVQTLYPFVVISNNNSKVIIRYGSAGLGGRAPHDHDDVLSYWYFKNGADITLERGCAPYTSDIKKREEYISAGAHNTISKTHGMRTTLKDGSVFRTVTLGKCSIEEISDNHVKLSYSDDDFQQTRTISLLEDSLIVDDEWLASDEFQLQYNLYINKAAEVEFPECFHLNKIEAETIEEYGCNEGQGIIYGKAVLPNSGRLTIKIL